MKQRNPRFLAITGPTASGKTDLSLALARHLPIEVISMDSRQVYTDMDVGTDKVSPEARGRVPHHGLDLVAPGERYSAGRFARDARRWIKGIEGRGAVPVLVGGTGFFLRALTDPVFAEPPLDTGRLDSLRAYLRTQPPGRLAVWVRHLDPARAELAIEGGPQRMGRTIEVALLSGRSLSWWHESAPAEADALPGVIVVLDLPRGEMDRRIDDRVSRMVERGLVEEVRRLLRAGFDEGSPGMTGTGYREVAAHLRGECTLDEAMEEIRLNTRRYARRQLTWFRNQMPDGALRLDAERPIQALAIDVAEAWTKAGGFEPRSRHGPREVGA